MQSMAARWPEPAPTAFNTWMNHPTCLPNNPPLRGRPPLQSSYPESSPFQKEKEKSPCDLIETRDPKVLMILSLHIPKATKVAKTKVYKTGNIQETAFRILLWFVTVSVCGRLGFLPFQHRFAIGRSALQALRGRVLSSEAPIKEQVIRNNEARSLLAGRA